MKNRSAIYPSCMKSVLYLVLLVVCVLLATTGFKGQHSRNAVDPRFLSAIFATLLLFHLKYICFEQNQIVVNYLFILRRKIVRERISSIEFVRESNSYYLLISLDNIKSFDSYKNGSNTNNKTRKVADYIIGYLTKVVYVAIPEKKRDEYIEIVKKNYPNVRFVNWFE